MVVPAAVRRQLEAHADAEAPNEACGLVAIRNGVAGRFMPAENVAASPYRFELKPGSPDDFFLEDEGFELAVFHSHPTDKAEPSRTDIENIGQWEGRPYLILSRPTGELRAWRIAGGHAQEIEIE